MKLPEDETVLHTPDPPDVGLDVVGGDVVVVGDVVVGDVEVGGAGVVGLFPITQGAETCAQSLPEFRTLVKQHELPCPLRPHKEPPQTLHERGQHTLALRMPKLQDGSALEEVVDGGFVVGGRVEVEDPITQGGSTSEQLLPELRMRVTQHEGP